MKNIKVMTSLLAALLVLILLPGVLAVAGPGLTKLNCSYYGTTAVGTPSDAAILFSGPQYQTAGQPYTTNTRDDMTFQIFAMLNTNSTNATYTTNNAVLYWDNAAISPTVTVAGYTNDTGALNATYTFSNATNAGSGTHSYFMRFYAFNHTALDNMTCGTVTGVSCTQYATNHATLANVTVVDCPTRELTIKYKAALLVCGDNVCTDGEPTTCPQDCGITDKPAEQTTGGIPTTVLIAIVLIVILGWGWISKKK